MAIVSLICNDFPGSTFIIYVTKLLASGIYFVI